MPRLTITEPQVEPPPEQDRGFDLYTGPKFINFEVGGTGRVHGTQNAYWVQVYDSPGTIVFDATFNNDGDLIQLSGLPGSWTVHLDGSNAVFERPGNAVWVPVGKLTWIQFSRGYSHLWVDPADGKVKLADQILGTDPIIALPESPNQDTSAPIGIFTPADGPGYLYTNGFPVSLRAWPAANDETADPFRVIGSDGPDHVAAAGLLQFDASFNRGGDTIEFEALDRGWAVSLSGSMVHFSTPDNFGDIWIPYGPHGLTIKLADGDATLIYDTASGHVLIGDQVITVEPAPLHPFA